jgi:RimJ/RimL family protein N-acetyltransferase
MTVPILETERLILRAPETGDFERWAEFHCDPDSMRHLGGPVNRAEAWRAMSAVVGMWPLLGFSEFSVVERASGRWIGRVGPWCPEGWPGREVGWMLHAEARGKGYAIEAATACMDFAFETLGWTHVIHVIDPRNQASQAVARRLGSVLEGPVSLPPPWDDRPEEAWGQSRESWRARRRRGS